MEKLTAVLIQEIADRIKAGAFEPMAVQSLGISLETYQKWLNTKGGRKSNLYQQLRTEVMRAKAHARLMAEMQLRTKEPKVWLLNGPGKQTPDQPGWTSPVKAASTPQESPQGEEQHSAEMMLLITRILQILTPFPEARIAVAEALAGVKKEEAPARGIGF